MQLHETLHCAARNSAYDVQIVDSFFFQTKKNNNDYHKCCRIKLKLTEEYFTHRRLSHSAKKNACT